MIKIDFLEFIRNHTWFGWQCISVYHNLDGTVEGRWVCSHFPRNWWIPIIHNDWKIQHFDEKETFSVGCRTFTPRPLW